MIVDSKTHVLNSGQIILSFLQEKPSGHPTQVMLPAIIAELNHPGVETKQFGNTLFELIAGKESNAFFKAFNADTAANFINNSKLFLVWAKHAKGMKNLVTQYSDSSITRIAQAIQMHPPMPGITAKLQHLQNGQTRLIINLGR
jgi:hypothetical protein